MYIYIYGGSALRSSVIISTGQMYIHFSNVLVAHVAHEAIYNIKYLLYIYVYIYTRVYIVCENIITRYYRYKKHTTTHEATWTHLSNFIGRNHRSNKVEKNLNYSFGLNYTECKR